MTPGSLFVAWLSGQRVVCWIAQQLPAVQRKTELVLRSKKRASIYVSQQISRTIEIPCRDIESQLTEKVARIVKRASLMPTDEDRLEIRGSAIADGRPMLQAVWRTEVVWLLAAELELFEPLDGFALARDDLRLPDKRNGHEAHGDDAKHKDESNVGLLSREAKGASQP